VLLLYTFDTIDPVRLFTTQWRHLLGLPAHGVHLTDNAG